MTAPTSTTGARARALLAALLALAAGRAAAAPLSQDEVLNRALDRSGAVRAARARAEAADAGRKSLRGRLLPSVSLSEELQRWDSAFVVPFPPPIGAVTAREQNTTTFTASVGQPLLGLLHIGNDLAAQGSDAEAARAQLRAAEADVKAEVLGQLVRLAEARALRDIARASVAQLTEQLDVARARLTAGVVTRADVLRIETAAANARQSEIQALAQEEAERAGLRVAVGEPAEAEDVDFEAPTLPEPAEAPALARELAVAREHRPELASARLAGDAARQRARARAFELLPEVDAEAAYLHVTGQAFSPEDASFIGLRAQWPIWDWGAKWYARSAAAKQAEAAAAQEVDARDRVSTEVAGRLATSRAAASAVGVSQTAVASAEEAYRVTDALVRAGTATTTDLLDAQAALTTAKSNLARARYGYALAQVNLQRSTGEL